MDSIPDTVLFSQCWIPQVLYDKCTVERKIHISSGVYTPSGELDYRPLGELVFWTVSSVETIFKMGFIPKVPQQCNFLLYRQQNNLPWALEQ